MPVIANSKKNFASTRSYAMLTYNRNNSIHSTSKHCTNTDSNILIAFSTQCTQNPVGRTRMDRVNNREHQRRILIPFGKTISRNSSESINRRKLKEKRKRIPSGVYSINSHEVSAVVFNNKENSIVCFCIGF